MKKEVKAKLKIRAVEIISNARRDLSHIADQIDPEVPSSDNFVRLIDSVLKAGYEAMKSFGINPMNGEPWPGEAGAEWREEVLSVIKAEASGKAVPNDDKRDQS